MSYSPDGFQFHSGECAPRPILGSTGAGASCWTTGVSAPKFRQLDATLVRTDTDGLQALFGYSYPVHGLLSGTFHATGTHANPEMTGFSTLSIRRPGAGVSTARAGRLLCVTGMFASANAELRLLPPPPSAEAAPPVPGLLTGNFDLQHRGRPDGFRLDRRELAARRYPANPDARASHRRSGQLSFGWRRPSVRAEAARLAPSRRPALSDEVDRQL